ncbi:hypothetical protein DFJ77DRAFT_437821 [Powellomyces hirtus]|nr:hypothetical protein DFJ77DRAFT_437821 [Powellomyces hirtus]
MGQPVNNQSFLKDLSQALWMLDLPNNKKLDGKNVDVQQFCSHLPGEVEMAVYQGHLANWDNALKYLSNKQLTGTVLTWLYSEVDRYKTFNEFREALIACTHAKKEAVRDVLSLCHPIPVLEQGIATVAQLNDQEEKYASPEGHQRPSMKSILVKGQRWDEAAVTFDNLFNNVYKRYKQGIVDGDLSMHRRIQKSDLKKIPEEATQSAAHEIPVSMGKDLASIKHEPRLTSASCKNPGKRIFLTEDGKSTMALMRKEHEDIEVFLMDRQCGTLCPKLPTPQEGFCSSDLEDHLGPAAKWSDNT